LAQYADLSSALAAIPSDYQKGGMSIKFVQSSDNKYVQFRCKPQSFSVNPEDWYFEGDDTLVENPEYIKAITDGAEHLLCWIRKSDGGIDWAVGVPQPVKDYVETKVVEIWQGNEGTAIDGLNKVIAFLDGFVSGSNLLEYLNETYGEYVDNPEFINAKTDKDGKILEYYKTDGTKGFGGDVEVGNKMTSKEVSSEKMILGGVEISNAATVDVNSIEEDPEQRLEVKTDSEKKIISYRKSDGTLVENVGIEAAKIVTNSLELTNEGMTEFQQALKDAGFTPGGGGDLSDIKTVQIPLPRQCAKINIICNHLPNDGESVKGELEYIDYDGNYFKKKIKKLKWQGDSSKTWHWKNYAFDLDDGSTIKFGNWVTQNSFQLKKFFADCLRGYSIISYRLGEQMYQTRALGDRKPFEYLYANESLNEGNAVFSEDFCTGALTHPDGFPFMLYHNGELQGLYAFCLKKDRANYNMAKKNANQIILDGTLNGNTVFGGNINWSQFELRNPGDLINMAGGEYDEGDELIDDTSEAWDATNADMIRSKAAKDNLKRLSDALADVDYGNPNKTVDDKKADFEKYFNVSFLIDYFLFGNIIQHRDGFDKNWIWCTWDGILWSPTIYDCDLTFGNGNFYCRNADDLVGIASQGQETTPSHILYRLYKSEIDARYKELRDKGVFSVDNIFNIFKTWQESVLYENLKKDIEECCVNSNGIPETPSYRNNNLKDGWILTSAANRGYPNFDPTKTYNAGESCTWENRYTLNATKQILPSDTPVAGEKYEYVPEYGGYHDSLIRISNWIRNRISIIDSVFNYSV
jgi:hypothetical protein